MYTRDEILYIALDDFGSHLFASLWHWRESGKMKTKV